MLKIKNTIPPHRGEKILYEGSAIENARDAMILIHGRGAGAESMRALIDFFDSGEMIFIIPQAANYTWYPNRFIEKRVSNEPGISSALALIHAIVASLNESGISNENIYFLGFSQGACLVADFAARYPAKYGGVFVLSGGLIGKTITPDDYSGNLNQTSVFLGCSDSDFHIPEERVHESASIFSQLNADIIKKIYPGMGHTINRDEIDHILRVITKNQHPVSNVRYPSSF